MFDLYLITDPDAPLGVVEVTRAALAHAPPGRVGVQLRAKDRSAEARAELARALRGVTREAGAPFLVNGDPELARAAGADGVHLPEGSMTPGEARAVAGSGAIVGVSCHDAGGVGRAAASGASFATLGPFAPSPEKGPPLCADAFAVIARTAELPILALGGIDASNAGEAVEAGAAGVAVIRAVFGSADPSAAVRALLRSLDTAHASGR